MAQQNVSQEILDQWSADGLIHGGATEVGTLYAFAPNMSEDVLIRDLAASAAKVAGHHPHQHRHG